MVVTMKKSVFQLAIVLLPVFLSSCNNDLLPNLDEGDPVFSFIGEIGGETYTLQAGREDVSMQTGFFKDTTGVWCMQSTLGPRNCLEGCPGSISIKFYDPFPSSDYSIDRSSFTNTGEWSLASGYPITVFDTVDVVQFFPDSNISQNSSILWDFLHGDTTSVKMPKRLVSQTRDLRACLNVYQGSMSANICNSIPKRNQKHCRIQFTYRQLSALTYEFKAVNGQTYNWEFGDGQTAYGNTVTHTYISPMVSNRSNYRVCIEANSSCQNNFCREISIGNVAFSGYSFEVYDSIQVRNVPAGLTGKLLITWIDADGIVYSNYLEGRAPLSSEYFQTQQLTPYRQNPDGYPTLKVQATAGVWLFNHLNPSDSLYLLTDQFVFALVQP
ncbi:MAG: hypothetical protein EA358_04130 [Flavobacteriales bacterium]|nr:MAG: hypothetical protein EA358_04130 [Flavobacteriales bacterium]